MSDAKTTVENTFKGFSAFTVMILFFWFWAQSGWYRVDCALKVQKACDLIAAEYSKKDRP